MGKLVVMNFVSLDGVVQSVLSADEDRDGGFAHGGWVMPYVDGEVEAFMSESTARAGGLLLGRRTYEIFAATWPHADPADPAVAAMNAMPKYVASRTLTDLEWENSTLLGPDIAGEIDVIKRGTDSDLLVLGSSGLLRTLVTLDVVDEYRLLTFPLILGTGKHMFTGSDAPRPLALVETVTSASGVLISTYRRTDR